MTLDNYKSKTMHQESYLALDKQADSEILQNELEILENWEKLWDMSFNTTKCQVIYVTPCKTPLQKNITSMAVYLKVSHLQNT